MCRLIQRFLTAVWNVLDTRRCGPCAVARPASSPWRVPASTRCSSTSCRCCAAFCRFRPSAFRATFPPKSKPKVSSPRFTFVRFFFLGMARASALRWILLHPSPKKKKWLECFLFSLFYSDLLECNPLVNSKSDGFSFLDWRLSDYFVSPSLPRFGSFFSIFFWLFLFPWMATLVLLQRLFSFQGRVKNKYFLCNWTRIDGLWRFYVEDVSSSLILFSWFHLIFFTSLPSYWLD